MKNSISKIDDVWKADILTIIGMVDDHIIFQNFRLTIK